MPSIRVYVPPDVYQEIEFDPPQFGISEALREEVALAFNTEVSHVEVLWISLDYTSNATPFAVEVLYSVLPSQNLDENARIALAEKLSSVVLAAEGLPEEVTEVSAWILPQHDAIFRTAKRQT